MGVVHTTNVVYIKRSLDNDCGEVNCVKSVRKALSESVSIYFETGCNVA